ncbi:MAG: AAA family ATPase [Terracidiphilus sp.]
MKRFILSGAPGSGKTAILRQLELDGFVVVEETATDVIALWQARGIPEPWTDPSFIDAIVDLQLRRELQAGMQQGAVQSHDRSVICTAALAKYLGYPFSRSLETAMERLKRESIFERQVLFIRNLEFISPTEARRISFEESLHFERIHEEIYRESGFDLISIDRASLSERVAQIKRIVASCG